MAHRIAASRAPVAAFAFGILSSLLMSCSMPASPPAKEAAPAASQQPAQPQAVQVSMAGEVNAMPSLAALGDRVILVWTGTKDGVMSVYSAVSEDRGATFNIQRRVNDQPGNVSANVEQPPRVAISNAGITVIWSAKHGGNTGIRMSRSIDGGKTYSPATTVHDSSLTGARGWESIAAGSDGTVHIVWLDGRNAKKSAEAASGEHRMSDMAAHGAPMDHSKMAGMAARPPVRQDVFEATIDQNGTVTEAPVAANVCFCCKTAVAVGAHGQVFAAWRHIFPGSMRDIAMAVSSDGGRTFGPLARVSEDKWEIAGCPEDGPSVALDASGTAHIVWPTVVSEAQPQKVVFYSSTKDGRTFAARARLSAQDQEEAAHPQVAVGSSGTVAVVWDEPHGNVRQVMFRTLGSGGRWTASRPLNPAGTASHPVVVPVADGFLVGWTGGEGATSALVLQRIGVSPAAVKVPAKREHVFRGKVESIDAKAGTMSVNGEDVEGWMGAMTMDYRADNRETVHKLKVGDQITAIVYDGDFQTLHSVQVVPR